MHKLTGADALQAMLLNPCRQRRRLRRGLDDWSNLYQHAVNADYDPAFIKKLQSMGWNWQYVDPRTQQEQPVRGAAIGCILPRLGFLQAIIC